MITCDCPHGWPAPGHQHSALCPYVALTGNQGVYMPDEQKTEAEVMAERRDVWKTARAMLRESDMLYTVRDVAALADWLNDGPMQFPGDDD